LGRLERDQWHIDPVDEGGRCRGWTTRVAVVTCVVRGPSRPRWIMPGTVWLRHAGYGVVEDWVEVGVEVGVTEVDGVTEELGDELGVGELVVGDAEGDVVGVVVADGEVDGERDGDAGAEVPWAGPTRSGG
jgi:hypothetical protein